MKVLKVHEDFLRKPNQSQINLNVIFIELFNRYRVVIEDDKWRLLCDDICSAAYPSLI